MTRCRGIVTTIGLFITLIDVSLATEATTTAEHAATPKMVLVDPTKPDLYRAPAAADEPADDAKTSTVQWPTIVLSVVVQADPPWAVVNEQDKLRRVTVGDTLSSGPRVAAIHQQGIELVNQGEKRLVQRVSCFRINQDAAAPRTVIRAGKCLSVKESLSP
ncbi:MAG: hypothetical protein HQL60_05135 [Magnetococcales bacterium]|nr:hypothetical protein [Magnetococcales bacterium]